MAAWLFSVASCFSGSICSSGVPAFTSSPDFTNIFVICPSTCGLITADCRDFSTDKYSVVSGMRTDCATCTCTGIAGGPPAAPGPPAEVFWPQPANRALHTPIESAQNFAVIRHSVSFRTPAWLSATPPVQPQILRHLCASTKTQNKTSLLDAQKTRRLHFWKGFIWSAAALLPLCFDSQ